MSKQEHNYKLITLFIPAFIFMTLTCFCKNGALSEKEKKNIIDTCISNFKTYYIYPAQVIEMEKYVYNRYRKGEYDSISDLQELTKQIRKDFRSVSNDRHIWIDILENLPAKDANVSDQEKIDELRKDNFGFTKLEMFPGNIAYLKMDAFVDYKYGSKIAFDVMNELAEYEAIILDLRDNHGGNENMVRFIASFFFAEKMQLNSLYFRYNDTLLKEWTDPNIIGNKMVHQKLLILTSENTSSAAESFTYVMKNYNRATIIGQNTKGAAHWKETFTIPGLGIFLEIPVGRPINPVTSTDWEGTGISPDISISAEKALDRAVVLAREWINRSR